MAGAQSPRPGSIAGSVVSAAAGEPLPHSVVGVAGAGRDRFADERATFRFPDLPPGAHALRVRHIGYAPADTTVFVRAGETAEVRVRLTPIAIRLAAVRVVASTACTAPGVPDAARDASFAAIFDQLRQNAEQFRLLSTSYPFEYVMERRFGSRGPAGDARFHAAPDTVVYESAAPRYRPGRVVAVERGGPRAGEQRLVLPTLLDLADPAFQANHCFSYAGTDTADGAEVVRIDFRAAARLRTPDVDGQIVLDAATYQIRAMRLALTRPPRGVRSVTASTRFREALPAIALFDSVDATTALRRGGRRSGPRVTVESQRLLEVRFLRALPGGDASPPASPPASPRR